MVTVTVLSVAYLQQITELTSVAHSVVVAAVVVAAVVVDRILVLHPHPNGVAAAVVVFVPFEQGHHAVAAVVPFERDHHVAVAVVPFEQEHYVVAVVLVY